MPRKKLEDMTMADIYPLYVAKVERKNRSQAELDQVIFWLTGYDKEGMNFVIEKKLTLREFFDEAPAYNPKNEAITGVICGIRVEEIEDPLMKKIRQMDKLVDEIAKGKKMEKILREA